MDEEAKRRAMALGVALRNYRTSAGLTVRGLAGYSGVSASYISRLERGQAPRPSAPTLQKIAVKLGITLPELMDSANHLGEGDPEIDALVRQVQAPDFPASERASIKDYLRFQLQQVRARGKEAIGRVVDLLDRDVLDEPAKPDIEPDAQKKRQQQ